jgi:hypothetical protein
MTEERLTVDVTGENSNIRQQALLVDGDCATLPGEQCAEVMPYAKPILRVGQENPSGKLGGNACCAKC